MNIKVDKLRFVSFLYILLPHILFYLYWIRIYYSIPLLLVCAFSIYHFYKKSTDNKEKISITKFEWIGLCGSVFIWLVFSGIGGLGFQTGDYLKHNALCHDIMKSEIPVRYTIDNLDYYLCHYFGYYLPPSIVGRFTNWNIYNITNIIWSYIGLLLGLLWFSKIIGKYKIWVYLCFFIFGGIRLIGAFYQFEFDQLIKIFNEAVRYRASLFGLNSLEYNFTFIFHNHTDLLYWSPQHSIGSWVIVGLFLNDWLSYKNVSLAPLYVALLAFWSPWAFVGILPFLAFAFFESRKNIDIAAIVCGLVFFCIAFLFLQGVSNNNLIQHFIFTPSTPELKASFSVYEMFKSYAFFLFAEVFIYVLPIFLFWKKIKSNIYSPKLLFIAVITLTLIPLYRYGQWNDFCSKAPIAAQYVLLTILLKLIIDNKGFVRYYLIFLLVCSSVIPAVTIVNAMRVMRNSQILNYPKEKELHDLMYTSEKLANWPKEQFIASDNSIFFKYIVKRELVSK